MAAAGTATTRSTEGGERNLGARRATMPAVHEGAQPAADHGDHRTCGQAQRRERRGRHAQTDLVFGMHPRCLGGKPGLGAGQQHTWAGLRLAGAFDDLAQVDKVTLGEGLRQRFDLDGAAVYSSSRLPSMAATRRAI